MEQDRSGTEWISAFLEWTFNDSGRSPAEVRALAGKVLAMHPH